MDLSGHLHVLPTLPPEEESPVIPGYEAGRPKSLSGCGGKETNFVLLPATGVHPACSLFTILTELPRFPHFPFLSALLLNTLNLSYSLRQRDQISHPYQRRNIIFWFYVFKGREGQSQFLRSPRHRLGPLEHLDLGFESHSRYGCMSAFFCIVLPCVNRGLPMGWSPVRGVLPKCLNGFTVKEVNSESEEARGLIRGKYKNNKEC
jgi:hypothetical protein